ncbi:MAG: recombinase family protein [Vicinamibacterales bacterium]
MKKFYAYTRVSTLKQGEKGVSLQEQHAAIDVYAQRHSLHIVEWFEETLTAAKKGRPLFTKMLKGLRTGQAGGVIIHKIDRSARNLRDWSDLGDLIDSGISVHFANESIDLLTRGGRLSADIQAVVASDFIRNLREETIKGMRGRLKQGIYPFGAPIGYLNTGSGRVKEIDPARGPLVRQAFELYGSGRYSLNMLASELWRRGLRSRRGREVTINGLSTMLNNSFYIGLMRISTTGETYQGKHTPLVPVNLFRLVKARLSGKCQMRQRTHDFTLRGLFRCDLCGRSLIGELQKGQVYYRCHRRDCPTKSFREDVLEAALFSTWPSFAPSEEWKERLALQLEHVAADSVGDEELRRSQIQLQLGALKERLSRLIDALVDGAVDKASFEMRKQTILEEQRSLEEAMNTRAEDAVVTRERIMGTLELACTAQQSYRLASAASRRELVIQLSSNRSVSGHHVYVEPHFPIHLLGKRALITSGDLHREPSRTFEKLAIDLVKWDSQQVVSDESIKAWKEKEHKRRYAHSYKHMDLINERRRKEREKKDRDQVA